MRDLLTILPGAAWHGLKIGLVAAVLALAVLPILHLAGLNLADRFVALTTGAVLVAVLLPISILEARRSGFLKR